MSEQSQQGWVRELYEARGAELVLYGRALGLSHGEAEDVLQDTFLALLSLNAPPEKPAHYCVRAFRNRALNFRRGFWRRVVRELESRHWFEGAAGVDPREGVAMRRLEGLPADQREVIVLRIWHGHTFEEIAAVTGVSVNTAAGRYRYGLDKLRSALQGNDHEHENAIGTLSGCLDSAPPVGPR